ncbi:MAG: fused response regulator/phosphatase, partial [Desulfovibrionales bacterium]|nr:fused response regulator/phosphatase [Desulfovibrionales bacterium]
LVVDDVPQNVRIMAKILEQEYEVLVALNGSDALDILKNDNRPDLVLLDVLMPGMDGYEVCRKIKNDPDISNIPVIFVTAKSTSEDEAYGLSLGAVDYITKPLRIPVVRARVKNHLELLWARRAEAEATRKISREVESMYDLQRSIMPAGSYKSGNLSVHGLYIPSGISSGDYFDYIPLEGGGVRCVVADVSGHGARASFIMAMVRTIFHFDDHQNLPLAVLTERLNRQLIQTVGNDGDFVTMFAIDIMPDDDLAAYINAGHCPGFLHNSDGFKEIEPTAPLLGLFEEDIPETLLSLGGAYKLLLYTDGIYECTIKGADIFGYDRFRDLCQVLLSGDKFDLKSLPGVVADS